MDVILFRHGIAIDREKWAGKEHDRPLTGKGMRMTRRSAGGLLNLCMTPTHLLSSPLTRARETAEILERLIRPRVTLQLYDELMPGAALNSLLARLAKLPLSSVAICVGHEPHLSLTAGLLLSGKPGRWLSLKKAGACLIHLEQSVLPKMGHLEWWLTAGQLRMLR